MKLRLSIPLAIVAGAALSACVSGGLVQVSQPTSARPLPPPSQPRAADGSIFAASGYRPLFEDRRARAVGDVLVVNITERLQASQQSKSGTDRRASTSMSLPIIRGVPGKSFQGAGVTGESSTQFEGGGQVSNQNSFTGTITVTVTEVLANGNLLVGGEKQIGLNHNSEIVRMTGVVNPFTIQPGNVIPSTQVADVRLEYIGRGYIDQAQAMPWLQRIFLSVLPF